MKRGIVIGLILIALILVSGATGCSNYKLEGSKCEYSEEPATCTITLMKQTNESVGGAYNGFDVKFRVNKEPEEYDFTLANSWKVGPKYVEKYGLKEGAVFDCKVLTITSGTCTPRSVKLNGVNYADYFESKNE